MKYANKNNYHFKEYKNKYEMRKKKSYKYRLLFYFSNFN